MVVNWWNLPHAVVLLQTKKRHNPHFRIVKYRCGVVFRPYMVVVRIEKNGSNHPCSESDVWITLEILRVIHRSKFGLAYRSICECIKSSH
jgi:hypothetical protein